MNVFSEDAEVEAAIPVLSDASSFLASLRVSYGISLERAAVLVMMAAEMEGGVATAHAMRLAALALSKSAAATARQETKRKPIRRKARH